MLKLTIYTDYQKYSLDQRTVFLFHKKDPQLDGCFILMSNAQTSKEVKARFVGFKGANILRATWQWQEDIQIFEKVYLNGDQRPPNSNELIKIVNRKSGKIEGKMSFKFRAKSLHADILFRNFDDYNIERKSYIDKDDKLREFYNERILHILDSFVV